jgi:hypothetical protein
MKTFPGDKAKFAFLGDEECFNVLTFVLFAINFRNF